MATMCVWGGHRAPQRQFQAEGGHSHSLLRAAASATASPRARSSCHPYSPNHHPASPSIAPRLRRRVSVRVGTARRDPLVAAWAMHEPERIERPLRRNSTRPSSTVRPCRACRQPHRHADLIELFDGHGPAAHAVDAGRCNVFARHRFRARPSPTRSRRVPAVGVKHAEARHMARVAAWSLRRIRAHGRA